MPFTVVAQFGHISDCTASPEEQLGHVTGSVDFF